MSVGGIILLVAVLGVFIFEAVSLVITAIKRSKERKARQAKAAQDVKIENNDKEGVVE